ncbi:MAG: element excision factor XisH family protein [Bacteroidota bacterium]
MAARDKLRDLVKATLIKQDWTIAENLARIEQEVNLGFKPENNQLIAAEKDGQKIGVQVESFLTSSTLQEMYGVVGRHSMYSLALKHHEPDRKLRIAVPKPIHDSFFQLPFIRDFVKRQEMDLMDYSVENQELTQ